MAKTIIQTIGPLYGEPVNGTVFGRPNGSIYVPAVNRITLSIDAQYVVTGSGSPSVEGRLYPASSTGTPIFNKVKMVAESQDNSAYMAIQISASDEFTVADEEIVTAGQFNVLRSAIRSAKTGDVTIVADSSYYCRAVLYASSGVPVAYSDTITLTGVVVS